MAFKAYGNVPKSNNFTSLDNLFLSALISASISLFFNSAAMSLPSLFLRHILEVIVDFDNNFREINLHK